MMMLIWNRYTRFFALSALFLWVGLWLGASLWLWSGQEVMVETETAASSPYPIHFGAMTEAETDVFYYPQPQNSPASFPWPTITGPQHWAVLMCKFSDVGSEPQGQSFFKNMFERTNGPSLDNYWREVSYNNITEITADAHGWFTLPKNRAGYSFSSTTSGFDVNQLIQDCINVANPSVNFAPYDAVAVMLNSDSPVAITTLFPLSYPDGAVIDLGAIAIPSNKYNLALVAHEMGHAYFLPHSSANGAEYQNPWDLMGIASGYRCSVNADPIYSCLGQHVITYYKDQLGWISPAQKYTAPIGTNTITLERLALPQTNNYLMAEINVGSFSYILEARQRVGYDAKLAGDAVLIHKNDDLVDATGAPYDDEGAMWKPGETFVDAANEIEVHIDSATATGFVITIKNGTEPHVSAMLSANPMTPAANEEVAFQTQLSYVDGNAGTVSATLSVTIPAEMTLVPNSVTTTAGSVITQNPPVVSIPSLGETAITITYRATVNGSITDPTAITIPVAVQWGSETSNFNHTVIANGTAIYLPLITK
jgi:hypothetical protein